MGFLRDLLSGNKDDSEDDLRMNSKRIGNNEGKLMELRAIRNNIPRRDVEALIDIDSEIEEIENRLYYLRARREGLHKKKYGHNNSEDGY